MATPYYQSDLATIYHGDCRDILSELEDGSVSLLLTDPPYGISYSPYGKSGPQLAIAGDGVRQGMRIVRQAFKAGAFTLAHPAHVYVFAAWQTWPDFYDAISPFMQIKNAMVWWKNRGGVGDTQAAYAYDFEMILYGNVGRRPLNGRRDGAVLAGYPPPGNDRQHPTEKPVDLLRYLVLKSSAPDDLVADWFMGSGTTLVAAAMEGRRAVGIEIEERYCEIAAKRLEALGHEPPMQWSGRLAA